MEKEKHFWFRDNWSGNTKSFKSISEAKAAAKNENGKFVTIYDEKGAFVVDADCSGIVYS